MPLDLEGLYYAYNVLQNLYVQGNLEYTSRLLPRDNPTVLPLI